MCKVNCCEYVAFKTVLATKETVLVLFFAEIKPILYVNSDSFHVAEQTTCLLNDCLMCYMVI